MSSIVDRILAHERGVDEEILRYYRAYLYLQGKFGWVLELTEDGAKFYVYPEGPKHITYSDMKNDPDFLVVAGEIEKDNSILPSELLAIALLSTFHYLLSETQDAESPEELWEKAQPIIENASTLLESLELVVQRLFLAGHMRMQMEAVLDDSFIASLMEDVVKAFEAPQEEQKE